MKNEGKIFEEDFKNSFSKEWYILRLQDNATGFGFNEKIRFTMAPPYDFICYKKPYLYGIELKSTKTKSFSIQQEKETAMIKAKQIKELKKAKEKGVVAGFVFNFRQLEETFFMDIDKFIEVISTNNKKSINYEEIKNNSIKIAQQKKVSRYRYNINDFEKREED